MSVNMNLSEAQINTLEEILSDKTLRAEALYNMPAIVTDNRILGALLRNSIVVYYKDDGRYELTSYGIQSYCATILTKYDGATHERIHVALNNYQRLFNS